MIQLLSQGQWALFAIIIVGLVISLSFHEYGHAVSALFYGDDTAKKQGRLSLNPAVHIDPIGLLMVVLVGFGYAKPVPTNPLNFKSRYADLVIAAAGPAMNLLLAIISINFYVLSVSNGLIDINSSGPRLFFIYLAQINILLMVFNLLPIGPLDGHYILPYFLPKKLAVMYRFFNNRYGNIALLALVAFAMLGIPIFSTIIGISNQILPRLVFF